jgi:hypothetical protein
MAMGAWAISGTLWVFAGFIGGAAHFALLRRNAMLYVTGGGLQVAIGLQILRLASIGLLLGCAAWHGTLSLLLAAFGAILARALVLWAT